MSLRKISSIVGSTLLAGIIAIWFTGFGQDQVVAHGMSRALHLVTDTWTGSHIRDNYYGVTPVEVWYTVRLLIITLVISLCIGFGIALLRARIRRQWAASALDIPLTLLEAIPEPVYIIITIMVVLMLLENTGINLPAFPLAAPSWADTVIPALALGLPGAFFFYRLLILHLRDEASAQYIQTAIAKGVPRRRVFYRHLLANVWPQLINEIPSVAAMVLSSALFVEFLFGYQGALFQLPMYGFGWYQKPAGLPSYEPGVIFELAALLIVVWCLFRLVSQIWLDARYPRDLVVTPAPRPARIQWQWIAVGGAFILAVITCSIDPHLVTPNNPNQFHLINFKTMQSAPYPPSHRFPLGTDWEGRDLLARALQGTWDTLRPAIWATLLALAGSLLLAALSVSNSRSWLSRFIARIGEVASALPVLLILLLAMRSRNMHASDQELQFILWIAIIETGRGAVLFQQAFQTWFQFGFVEGATSVGRRRIGVLFTHFRRWLQYFGMEYVFSEFGRVLSLMTMLAVFRIYSVQALVWRNFGSSGHFKIIGSAFNTWFSMLGNVLSAGAFPETVYWLYAPVLLLMMVSVGANLIAKGLKGVVDRDAVL